MSKGDIIVNIDDFVVISAGRMGVDMKLTPPLVYDLKKKMFKE